ncbi:keratin, type I cytoskeletal 9-like [Amphibalanus amphitrite]|nr:keratin, type I cytoskeletal 9-like [Amphibalanus amphitrite]
MKVAVVLTLLAALLAEPCCGQGGFFPRPGFAQGSGGANLLQAQQSGPFGGSSNQFVSSNANSVLVGPGSSSSFGAGVGSQSSGPFGGSQQGFTTGGSNQQSFGAFGRRK